jgi:hypothetical protein
MTHEDVVVAVGRADSGGNVFAADELARVTATNLGGELAAVIDTATALRPR